MMGMANCPLCEVRFAVAQAQTGPKSVSVNGIEEVECIEVYGDMVQTFHYSMAGVCS